MMEVPQVQETKTEQKKVLSPLEFLAQFQGAPSAGQIELWKNQAPGGRVRLFSSPDAKRAYIMRGIGAQELVRLTSDMPQNISQEKFAGEIQISVSVRCCLWTSSTPDGKLTDLVLRGSGAGLPVTLHEVVSSLSDFMDPVTIEQLSADL